MVPLHNQFVSGGDINVYISHRVSVGSPKVQYYKLGETIARPHLNETSQTIRADKRNKSDGSGQDAAAR